MTLGTVRGTDRIAVLAVLDPKSQAAATVTTGWVPVASWDAILAVLQAGALGASATIDAKLQQASDSSGTGAKDVTGKAITQLTQAGTDKSNKQVVINCRTEDLDVANNFSHVRLSVTVATAASLMSAVLIGVGNRRGAATQAATVNQVVS
jgi:hypothetical protein